MKISMQQAFALLVSYFIITMSFLPEVSGKECTNQLADLETSLLSNQGNLENLTRAFIPPNQPSPLVVRVCYYVIDPVNNTNPQDGDCQNASYIFRWSPNSIFLYAPVDIMKALTLNLAQITQQTAVLTIDAAPVCDILLLNYLSTLLRAYMSARSNKSIDETLVGSIAFYNASQDDFLLLVGNTDLGQTPLLLTISGTLLILCAAFGVPMAIYAAYDHYDHSGKPESSTNYYIGGFVLVLSFAVPVAYGYDIYNFRSLDGTIQSDWIKYVTVSGGSAVIVYGFIVGFAIACLKRNSKVWLITDITVVSVIIQALGIGLTVGFSALIAFHGYFIVFFLLLTSSPEHITVGIVFYGAGFFSCVVITALFLALLKRLRYKNHDKKCCTCLATSYLIFFFTLVYAFLVAFIYSFSGFISFSNSCGGGGSYIATLTPSMLLTGLGIFLSFILKKQTSLMDPQDAYREMS